MYLPSIMRRAGCPEGRMRRVSSAGPRPSARPAAPREQFLHLRLDLVRVETADGERRAPPQHVLRGLRPLVVARVDDLCPDLRSVRVDALAELGPLVGQPGDV